MFFCKEAYCDVTSGSCPDCRSVFFSAVRFLRQELPFLASFTVRSTTKTNRERSINNGSEEVA